MTTDTMPRQWPGPLPGHHPSDDLTTQGASESDRESMRMMCRPGREQFMSAASLDRTDDHALITALLGSAAARQVGHIPVSTLLDTDAPNLAALGLRPAALRRLLVAAELARRFQPVPVLPERLTRPRDILPHLKELRTRPVEVLGVLLVDSRQALLDGFIPIASGALMRCAVHPREVFAEAVARRAAAVVLAHNHPADDPVPSLADRKFTKTMVEAARLLGIGVLDHMIVTRRAYFSFSEADILHRPLWAVDRS